MGRKDTFMARQSKEYIWHCRVIWHCMKQLIDPPRISECTLSHRNFYTKWSAD